MDGWIRHYPVRHFPSLWERVDVLIDEGRFLVSEEVIREVNQHDDTLQEWLNKRRDAVVVPTTSEVVDAVRRILEVHARLVMSGVGRNRADPFVIAVARLKGATVVTGEKGGTPKRPKIPFVCDDLRVPCFGMIDLIRQEDWVFS